MSLSLVFRNHKMRRHALLHGSPLEICSLEHRFGEWSNIKCNNQMESAACTKTLTINYYASVVHCCGYAGQTFDFDYVTHAISNWFFSFYPTLRPTLDCLGCFFFVAGKFISIWCFHGNSADDCGRYFYVFGLHKTNQQYFKHIPAVRHSGVWCLHKKTPRNNFQLGEKIGFILLQTKNFLNRLLLASQRVLYIWFFFSVVFSVCVIQIGRTVISAFCR